MTWSPFASVDTPGPTSTTTPAPSCPRIAGNKPSGSAPERVNSSVWQMPVALISTSTSPAFGPSRRTVSTTSGAPAWCATAALTSIVFSRLSAPMVTPIIRPMISRLPVLLVAALLCLSPAAPAQLLRYASQIDHGDVDPHALASVYNNRVLSQIYESLIDRDA